MIPVAAVGWAFAIVVAILILALIGVFHLLSKLGGD